MVEEEQIDEVSALMLNGKVDEDSDANRLSDLGSMLSSGLGFQVPDIGGSDAIQHADNAVDFEDEDELADEEDIMTDNKSNDAFSTSDNPTGSDIVMTDDLKDFDDDATATTNSDLLFDPAAIENAKLEKVKEVFPEFRPHRILKLTAMFSSKPLEPTLRPLKPPKPCIPSKVSLDVDLEQSLIYSTGNNVRLSKRKPVRKINQIESQLGTEGASSKKQKVEERELWSRDYETLALATAEWKDENILNPQNNPDPKAPLKQQLAMVENQKFEFVDWDEPDSAILTGDLSELASNVYLDLNDPKMLLQSESDISTTKNPATHDFAAGTNLNSVLKHRYNFSNDEAYDLLKENYQSKVRSVIGNLTIDHSLPAKRLQSPYYKVRLSKAQARSYHRPNFNVKPRSVITFNKLKQRKKKRDRGKNINELFASTKDLSANDTAQIFLTEYSEEFPMVLSNFGMGSKIINYYRKTSETDENRPKLSTGETYVLGVQDRSPFWNFGYVDPGKLVPTLYNNMIRAPIFAHKPQDTDFLLSRSTTAKEGQKYYLRPLKNLWTVGQTFPVTEIPGPHSRRVTTASKNRLKMIVYRILHTKERERLVVKDIAEHLPGQTDMQTRQRLKEFMEYQRTGEDQGFWKLRNGDPLPEENEIKELITPEEITMLEVMQVGMQRLEDAGYGKTVDDDNQQDGMSVEEQLAPWMTSRNFINATQGKAMLKLHGEGEPTGRGEAFNLIRTSMKGGFKAQGESVGDKLDKSKFGGHAYNVALQQKAYEEEIAKIWDRQNKSLSVTNIDDIPWQMDLEEDKRNEMNELDNLFGDTSNFDKQDDDDGISQSQFSHASGKSSFNRVLRITRQVKNSDGTMDTKTEYIHDPNVIHAYVRRRQEIEDMAIPEDEITITDNPDVNARNRKRLEKVLARLKRNRERREARKAQRGEYTTEEGGGEGDEDGDKGKMNRPTTRKCATCGQIGHIRTNRACPMYNERLGPGGETPAEARY
ncbi:hypothetical protein CANCADRAFT_31776 [Tortispora caseinolytica NRRL Y-17796]|uniref:Transcription initiation factor TFIID subunit 1 histone acetyltransferase domain-containing protein n=1 Tax=Tortispora caseinolytica NRRL Y-17796 TaxID=767744 RepID=A0A1E4TGU6_9ASCO|nr:hypothetical protein CANCADRAFT_31776 [Tortispora caseinolytica NRRL Y-17796]